MDPKFQTSFIPKGPINSPSVISSVSRTAEKGLLGFIASIIFLIAVVIAGGLFGYEKYLISSIASKGSLLEKNRSELDQDTIKQLLKLNSRILSTTDILDRHTVLSPLFDFLESSTFKSVRYTSFRFVNSSNNELTIALSGQARGYSAVALQADELSKSQYIKNPIFSDLLLDDKGNVLFNFKANLDPGIISYKRQIDSGEVQTSVPNVVVPVVVPTVVSTTTSTTSPNR